MDCGRVFHLSVLTAFICSVLLISVLADDLSPTGPATPVFVSEPQNITTLQGQSIQFICRVHNLQSWQSLIWRHIKDDQDVMVALDNRLLVIGGERSVVQEEDGRVIILRLQSATIDQEGNYVCVVSGIDQKQINQLTVNVPAAIVATEPRGTTLNVLEGRPLYLSCSAEGKPEPVITWTKQGRQPFVGDSLALPEASKEDGGTYTCVADNGAGDSTSRQFNVNVHYGPRVRVPTSVVHVGLHQRVTLECIFDANPPVREVSWSKDETPFNAEGNVIPSREDQESGLVVSRLQIVNTNPGDVGDYRCSGDNGLGPASDVIFVSGLPYDLQVTSERYSPFSNQFTVRWSVRSESVLQETEIILVQDVEDVEESISAGPLQQKQFTIRMKSADQQLPVYSEEFVLNELRPNSSYKLRLRVGNVFGFGNWTDEFRFETAEEGNEAPLSTTLGTTQLKGNLADDNNSRPRYTHHQTRNEPYGAGSLASSSFLSSFASIRIFVFAAILSKVPCWILYR